MKWLLIVALGSLGCADNAPPPAPGGGGPIPPGGFAGSGGSAGAGGVGGEGGAGGMSEGACDKASDLDAIEGAGQSVRDLARDCGRSFGCASSIGISGRYGDCVSDCVEEGVDGLSTECADCYGALERCGLESFCRPQCQVNTCSTLCLDCLEMAGCIEDYEICRGLPGDSCPG